MVVSMLAETNERRDLRKKIDSQLRTDQDLDAFFVDFFPDVYRRLSSGMERAAKVNLLFTLVETQEISAQLKLCAKPERRLVARRQPRGWGLAIALVVGVGSGWIVSRSGRYPISMPAEKRAVTSEPHISTYPAVDDPASPLDMTAPVDALRLQNRISRIKLNQNAKAGLLVLSHHWNQKKSNPPILDSIIENNTSSRVIVTGINLNVTEYYPSHLASLAKIVKPTAVIDIGLPPDAGQHFLHLEDPIEILSGQIARLKFRFLDKDEIARVDPRLKPYYKFELGIIFADSSMLVIDDLSLSKFE